MSDDCPHAQDRAAETTERDSAHPAEAMTPEELAEAKRYGRCDLACMLADKVVDVAYLGVMALVVARPIDAWLSGFPLLEASRSLRLLAMLGIVFGFHVLVSFPLSCYSGHVLEHQFGLSNQTFRAWLWRYAKRVMLAGGFSIAMFWGLFWLIWITGPYWWIAGAGAFFVVSVVLGQLLPVLILPLFYKIERLDRPELDDRLARLAEGTGLSIEGVYRMGLSEETAKANAMLSGLGRTRRVLLADTLLDRFTPEEIEVIFAHEIGHHVFRHVRKILFSGILYSAAGFWICDRLLGAWVAGAGGAFDYSQTPVAAAPLLMFLLTVFVLVLEPVQNAISRRYERQSDRYALDRTGAKAAYRSAFRKLARVNKADPDPHWLDVLLFHGHPPIVQRLALAEEE
ncbi:MAG TPA: M48 family metallopeptidase [Thermoguttaceae bacterium]|nr:M48 family metallopeptidase [Thermoguttaceae bacterium]